MRYANDGTDYDGGYNGGYSDSESARRGLRDRRDDDARNQSMIAQASKPIFNLRASPRSPTPRAPSAPATFSGTVKSTAIAGLALAVAYAYLELNLTSWEIIAVWAIKGLLYGAVAGVALYAIIIVLRVAITCFPRFFQSPFGVRWALECSMFFVSEHHARMHAPSRRTAPGLMAFSTADVLTASNSVRDRSRSLVTMADLSWCRFLPLPDGRSTLIVNALKRGR